VIPRLFGSFPALDPELDVDYVLTHLDGEAGRYELFSEGHSIQKADGPGSMIDWIVSDMSQRALCQATRVVSVHAACLVRDGTGLVLVGPPDHGKTTTALGLVRSGWSLLSDEAGAISLEDGRAQPFPRPLMVSGASMALFPGLVESLPAEYGLFRRTTHHVGFVDLGLQTPEPATISLIVAPSYGADHETSLDPMTRSEALLLMLDQCFNFTELGDVAVTTLGQLSRDADCFRLTIGDLNTAVELLDALVDTRRVA
jgi:hypothetical protein